MPSILFVLLVAPSLYFSFASALQPDAQGLAVAPRAKPSPTCSYAVRDPVPSNSVCGSRGTIANPDPIGSSTVPSSSPMALDSCRDDCLGNMACKSFAFDYNTNNCTQYGSSLRKQGFTAGQQPLGVLYYGRSCFAQSCTGSARTITSTLTLTVPARTVTKTAGGSTTTVSGSTSTVTSATTNTITSVTTNTVTTTSTNTIVSLCAVPADPIENGGFETGDLSPWTFEGTNYTTIHVDDDPANAYSGSYYASVDTVIGGPTNYPGDTIFSLNQTFAVCPKVQYALSFYSFGVQHQDGASLCKLLLCVDDNCAKFSPEGGYYDPGTTYGQTTFNFTPGANANSVTLAIISDNAFLDNPYTPYCFFENIRFDNFTITPLNATY